MAETSGFFNAEELGNGQYDREYYAQQFAYYFALFIGNGVFMDDSSRLQVVQDAGLGMDVIVNPGDAFINGYWYANSSPLQLDVDNASSVYGRIDSVVVRWDVTTREIRTVIKKGEPAAQPQPPAITRNDGIWELELARIELERAQTGITDADITDMRLNDEACGVVHGVVDQVKLQTLFIQFTSWYEQFTDAAQKDILNWFKDLTDKLGDVPAANLQIQIDNLEQIIDNVSNSVNSNVTELLDQIYFFKTATLPASGWSASAPFTQTISVPGLKSSYRPFVQCVNSPGTKQDKKVIQKQWNFVDSMNSGDGTLTAVCKFEKPTIDFQIVLKGV